MAMRRMIQYINAVFRISSILPYNFAPLLCHIKTKTAVLSHITGISAICSIRVTTQYAATASFEYREIKYVITKIQTAMLSMFPLAGTHCFMISL
jgi:hypothetical protein